ncbi:MAG: hypothetical protein AAGF15_05480 [Pseudomonadota bacterium]
MTYLLFQIFIFLLIAFVGGWVFGSWWQRDTVTKLADTEHSLVVTRQELQSANAEIAKLRSQKPAKPTSKSAETALKSEVSTLKAENADLRKDLAAANKAREKAEAATEKAKAAAEKVKAAPKPAPAAKTSTPAAEKKAPAPVAEEAEDVALAEPQEVEAVGEMPRLLDAAEGEPDDLKKIKGVGPKLEQTLNDLGIFHYSQIAGLTTENVAWIDAHLRFSGRIERDDWIGQAKSLAKG